MPSENAQTGIIAEPPRKRLTGRQQARRAGILSAVRQLIAELGYDGVTMREIARRSGVATSTLYEIYGGKDKLLARAVDERLKIVSDAMQKENDDGFYGAERLLHFFEQLTNAVLERPKLSRAVAARIMLDPHVFTLPELYSRFHKAAIIEIEKIGELTQNADPKFLVKLLHLQANAILVRWAIGGIPSAQLNSLVQLTTAITMLPYTKGATRELLDKKIQAVPRGSLELTDIATIDGV